MRVNYDPLRTNEFAMQMTRIRQAGLPTSDFQIVEVFQDGKFRPHDEIDSEVLQDSC